ncbi:MAG: hypothetical protein ABIQ95_01410 [Bdellovibrionia bacterium]
MIKRCGNCGSSKIATKNQKGKSFPWRDYEAVRLDASLNLIECSECGELILKDSDIGNLDEAVEQSIRKQVAQMVDKIIMREDCSQVELASHLGVSKEYLTEIKSGRKIPKFQLYNFLKTIAIEGKAYKASDPKLLIA